MFKHTQDFDATSSVVDLSGKGRSTTITLIPGGGDTIKAETTTSPDPHDAGAVWLDEGAASAVNARILVNFPVTGVRGTRTVGSTGGSKFEVVTER